MYGYWWHLQEIFYNVSQKNHNLLRYRLLFMSHLSSYIQMIVYSSKFYLTSVRYIIILFRAVNRDVDNYSFRCDIVRQGSLYVVKRGYLYFMFVIISLFSTHFVEEVTIPNFDTTQYFRSYLRPYLCCLFVWMTNRLNHGRV